MNRQRSLFGEFVDEYPFPTTRYQGSKRTLVNWIKKSVSIFEFDTVLDVFGGTGAVSHAFKQLGKQVIYNDHLTFNWMIGRALVENANTFLSDENINHILTFDHQHYPDFIQRTFQGIYFTESENRWLDQVIYNINHRLADEYKRALAFYALFQACIVKRPYNLFHRANLYMREADVQRSFGNKITWDTPFEEHFRNFISEANAAVFDNGRRNQALNLDALDTPTGADLVYLDPPYINAKGVGVDYRDFYHFLEGISHYDEWADQIDSRSKHKRLRPVSSAWHKPKEIATAFEALVSRHQQSILVLSYRDDGIPSKDDLITILKRYKQNVIEESKFKQYVLSKQTTHEILLIAY